MQKKRPTKRRTDLRGRAPTIHDVARAAKVSTSTVSNVVNGNYARVSEKTKRRVLQHIERIGYRPHATGRSLRTASRRSLAIVIIDESENYLLDPFASNLVAGFTKVVNDRGYTTILYGGQAKDFTDIVVVNTLGVDGYCFFLSGNDAARKDMIQRLSQLNQPIVLAQETITPSQSDICIVRQDDYGGGVQLADHLIARGARRMAFVMPQLEWPALTARVSGLRAGIKGTGQSATLDIVRCSSEAFRDVVEAVDKYIDSLTRKPDALLGANDQIAIASMHALRRRGLRIPDDILITGFNAFEFWQYSMPMLTTVLSPARQLGELAANLLVTRLLEGTFPQTEYVLPVSLQVSGSSSLPSSS